jgi:hypothetical protein
VAKVIEYIEAHYQVEDVEMGKVYRWCPERAVVECGCANSETFIAFRKPICSDECGEDLTGALREVLDARSEDEGDHPWRSLQPYKPTRGT